MTVPAGGALCADLSMQPSAWEILYSPTLPRHPDADGEGWSFALPECGGTRACSVGYVMAPVNLAASRAAVADVALVVTAGAPVFHYDFDGAGACDRPASVRLMLQRKDDDLTAAREFFRWWSEPVAFPLSAGAARLVAAIEPGQWISVFGKRGDADERTAAAFRDAMQNLGHVGFTFGGGCFYGHGVNVTGGGARFKASAYTVN